MFEYTSQPNQTVYTNGPISNFDEYCDQYRPVTTFVAPELGLRTTARHLMTQNAAYGQVPSMWAQPHQWNTPCANPQLPVARAHQYLPSWSLREDKQSFYLDIEMPGVVAKEVAIFFSGSSLIVRGEKHPLDLKQKECVVHDSQRFFGPFEFVIALPFVDLVDHAKINAKCREGIFTIELPKSKDGQKTFKKISVATTR